MDTISVIVKWLTRKITAIRYAQERSTKVFDLVAEIKKVNLASAKASVGQDIAPEDLAVDFTSTALITQFEMMKPTSRQSMITAIQTTIVITMIWLQMVQAPTRNS
jgi:hypothetical protein